MYSPAAEGRIQVGDVAWGGEGETSVDCLSPVFRLECQKTSFRNEMRCKNPRYRIFLQCHHANATYENLCNAKKPHFAMK